MVQWLGSVAFTDMAGVRFPVGEHFSFLTFTLKNIMFWRRRCCYCCDAVTHEEQPLIFFDTPIEQWIVQFLYTTWRNGQMLNKYLKNQKMQETQKKKKTIKETIFLLGLKNLLYFQFYFLFYFYSNKFSSICFFRTSLDSTLKQMIKSLEVKISSLRIPFSLFYYFISPLFFFTLVPSFCSLLSHLKIALLPLYLLLLLKRLLFCLISIRSLLSIPLHWSKTLWWWVVQGFTRVSGLAIYTSDEYIKYDIRSTKICTI